MTAQEDTATHPASPDRASTHTYETTDVPVDGGMLRVGVWDPIRQDPVAVPTVLAIHGITASHRAWAAVAEALPGVRVVAPDLRGRGRSNGLPGPYGMARHADDVAAVVRALGEAPASSASEAGAVPADRGAGGPVTVVGHSMGGFVGVVLAHRHPDLVGRLLLVDGGLPLQPVPGLPADATADDIVAALLGPALERLSRVFESRQAYRDFWRTHPAFAEWTPTIEQYVDYDLDEIATPRGTDGHAADGAAFRPATTAEAVAGDSADMYTGDAFPAALDALVTGELGDVTMLRAPRGLMDEPGGMYPEPFAAEWSTRAPTLTIETVADVNHYTILMSPPGVAAVRRDILHDINLGGS
ncbi:alpha/beta fold hydrolase [Myceligenerans xiligouense]|uniref:Alpha/beta hydrolase family protein n=1 Tax=Myceligenerans xiligouense TaxID=253184 RepID=A0A3N4YNE1_9MICO|nr:alpha/beta fold hydrolase [Myceligenerans xiligouense]RPF22569.1 alpha/beta hydrolase family protein [Myceligenerans xiligouense]